MIAVGYQISAQQTQSCELNLMALFLWDFSSKNFHEVKSGSRTSNLAAANLMFH